MTPEQTVQFAARKAAEHYTIASADYNIAQWRTVRREAVRNLKAIERTETALFRKDAEAQASVDQKWLELEARASELTDLVI